jgi:DNA-binding NarL/FixJ family response regulator
VANGAPGELATGRRFWHLKNQQQRAAWLCCPRKERFVRDEAAIVEPHLTQRQREVLELLALGSSNKNIATQLHISRYTLQHHLAAVYAALGVRTRIEAAVWAVQHRLPEKSSCIPDTQTSSQK